MPATTSVRQFVPRASNSKYRSALRIKFMRASQEPLLPAVIQAFAATASDTMSETGLMSGSRETRAGSVVSMTNVSLVS